MAPTGRPAVLNFLYDFSQKGQARSSPEWHRKARGLVSPARPGQLLSLSVAGGRGAASVSPCGSHNPRRITSQEGAREQGHKGTTGVPEAPHGRSRGSCPQGVAEVPSPGTGVDADGHTCHTAHASCHWCLVGTAQRPHPSDDWGHWACCPVTVRAHTHTDTCVHTDARKHSSTQTHARTHMCKNTYWDTHTYTWAHTQAQTHRATRAHTHTCVQEYLPRHTHTHTHAHTPPHTPAPPGSPRRRCSCALEKGTQASKCLRAVDGKQPGFPTIP